MSERHHPLQLAFRREEPSAGVVIRTSVTRAVAIALGVLIVSVGVLWAVSREMSDDAAVETYRLVAGWPSLGADVEMGQVSGVGVDRRGDVLVFRRAGRAWESGPLDSRPTIAANTVLIIDAVTGELRDAWGADAFSMPHGLTVDANDHVWLTDVGLHQVFEFDRAGNVLLTLGERRVPGSDATHFNMPTDVAVSPDGAIYVSDGYVNSRVVEFSAEGRFLREWGTKGSAPGQFDLPHSIAVDGEGRVYVADRGNARLQVFDREGRLLAVWRGARYGRPWAVRIGPDGTVYLVDGGDQRASPPDRARVLVCDPNGRVLGEFGSYGTEPGQFVWPHSVAVGRDGSLYVGEVTGRRVQKFERAR